MNKRQRGNFLVAFGKAVRPCWKHIFPIIKGHRKKRPLIQLVRCGEYKKKAKVKRTESLVNTFVSNQVWMQCLIVAVYKSYHYHNINMEQFLEAWPNIIQQIKVRKFAMNV